jgi:K319-like protein
VFISNFQCPRGVFFMKNITFVVLILLLGLGTILSAPAGLFLFNANAQSISTIFASIPAAAASSLLNFNLVPEAHAICANFPCIAPKPTTLTLNPIADTPFCNTATVTGKLAYSSTGTGLDGEGITFSSDNGGTVPGAVVTKSDGTFSTSFPGPYFTVPCSVGSGWHLQAHFTGDSDVNALGSNSAIQTYNTIKHSTLLSISIEHQSSSSSDIPWGTTATVTGVLTDNSAGNIPVASAPITFTSPNGSPIPLTNPVTTDRNGFISYIAVFTTPNTISTEWKLQAHFAGDSNYLPTDSPVQNYNTVKHSTAINLFIVPTSVNPVGTYSASGTLIDTSTSVRLVSKTITFTATSPITITSRNTNTLGQYFATGLIAPSTPGTYSIQSHYVGESLYNAANSPTQTLTVSTTAAGATTRPTTPTSTTTTAVAPGGAPSSTGSIPITPSAVPTARQATAQVPVQAQSALSPQLQPQQLQLAQHLPIPPVANAGLSKTALVNTIVILDGRASYSPIGGNIIEYQWVQLPIGVPVTLTGSSTATPMFTAPVVNADTMLEFSLRVMDSHGAVSSNSAVVYVMVKHNPNIGPFSGNTQGSTTIQLPPLPQQQQQQQQSHQPIVLNDNAISPSPQPTLPLPSTSVPQMGPRSAVPTVVP